MGRAKKKQDNRGPLQRAMDNERVANDQSFLDVLTPEQLASGDYATADNRGRRYFRTSHLDRLHKNGKLTYEQQQAGEWYRTQYAKCRYDSVKISKYGEAISGVPAFDVEERKQDARDLFRVARAEIPRELVGFMDRFLLHDRWPQSRHQSARKGYLADVRRGLDELVRFLRLA